MTHPPRLPGDVLTRIREFLDALAAAEVVEPTAMTLATAGADGRASSRVVLLKDFDADGFVFYTNLGSRKADQLRENPWGSLTFFRAATFRQLHAEGPTEPVSDAEADAYWATRPRESQVGAWASKQSSPLSGRDELEQRVREFEQKYEGGDVPRPQNWSGYRLRPVRLELWTARDFRLHDRDCWTAEGGEWSTTKLFP